MPLPAVIVTQLNAFVVVHAQVDADAVTAMVPASALQLHPHVVGLPDPYDEVLAAPVDGRLFFAGEATSPEFFSTAHGARDSGERAAEEVMAATNSR